MRPPSPVERVCERPARRAAGQRRRAQPQDRNALERARQALPDVPDHVRSRHLDLVEGKLAVDGAVEGPDLAAQRHARRAARDHEERGARDTARMLRHLRDGEEEIGPRATRDEGLHTGDEEGLAAASGRGARALARIGEGQRRRRLAAEHRAQEALALGARREAKEPAVATQGQVPEHAARAAHRFVQGDHAESAHAPAAEIGGLEHAIEAERGGARAHPALERGGGVSLVGDPRRILRRAHLLLEEAREGRPEPLDLGGHRMTVGHGELQRALAASDASAMHAKATLAVVGTPNRAV